MTHPLVNKHLFIIFSPTAAFALFNRHVLEEFMKFSATGCDMYQLISINHDSKAIGLK